MTKPGDTVLILAGKGHNGDDARLAGEQISGRAIRVLQVNDPVSATKEISQMLLSQIGLIIDGLFGIGLNRPLNADWVELIRQINESRVAILAVDVPSGLNADTGKTMPEAIRAMQTTTLGAPKRGLVAANAWEFVGRLEVAPDIGLISCPISGELNWTLAQDFSHFPPPRAVAGHKGAFGHLSIVAGSLGYHGAAVLAARAAQRAQPGLITLCTSPAVYQPVAAQLQAPMVRPWTEDLELPENTTAILIGPGLAARDLPEFIRVFTRRIWQESPLPVIVDASALEWLPPGSVRGGGLRVMTPHPGEAARLLQSTSAKVQQDRASALRELSRRFGGCTVVLKGHQTLVGGSDGRVLINSSGNPHLAQGGSGDLLAGYLAGFLAQPLLQRDAFSAIRYAVWQHGVSADQLQSQRVNWTIEDLAVKLGCIPI